MADSKLWNDLEQVVDEGCGDVGDICLLNLRARVEALEAAQHTHPEQPDACAADGLVERVTVAICEAEGCGETPAAWRPEARAAIREVAAAARSKGYVNASLLIDWLEREGDRG